MDIHLASAGSRRNAVPLVPLTESDRDSWLKGRSAAIRQWVKSTGFSARPGEISAVPGGDGSIVMVLAGYDPDAGHWAFGGLPSSVPPGIYRLDPDAPRSDTLAEALCLGWALGSYAFSRYKKSERGFATLQLPEGVEYRKIFRTAQAVYMIRDLINTPTADLGPADLAEAARALARSHRATFSVIVGDELLARNFPLIHAVGRASQVVKPAVGRDRRPRLVDFKWGRPGAYKVTLVGKGVCFDTGGLNLKNDAGMKLMKKDMGGAAHVLGLASMIMDAGLGVRLRVLIPAVENSIGGNAMRPLDVVRSRKGLTVEIGNTDAEGRLILCDALAEACRDKPDLLIDCATLTGAARVALGPDVPALFSNDDRLADDLVRHGEVENDPLWRLPLWRPYRDTLKSPVADLSNISEGPFAGAITAALYLAEFVDRGIPWVHLDMMAWNATSRPGRPQGGEAVGVRALYALIASRAAQSVPKRSQPTPRRRKKPR